MTGFDLANQHGKLMTHPFAPQSGEKVARSAG
jgi:hypothetical protein